MILCLVTSRFKIAPSPVPRFQYLYDLPFVSLPHSLRPSSFHPFRIHVLPIGRRRWAQHRRAPSKAELKRSRTFENLRSAMSGRPSAEIRKPKPRMTLHERLILRIRGKRKQPKHSHSRSSSASDMPSNKCGPSLRQLISNNSVQTSPSIPRQNMTMTNLSSNFASLRSPNLNGQRELVKRSRRRIPPLLTSAPVLPSLRPIERSPERPPEKPPMRKLLLTSYSLAGE